MDDTNQTVDQTCGCSCESCMSDQHASCNSGLCTKNKAEHTDAEPPAAV